MVIGCVMIGHWCNIMYVDGIQDGKHTGTMIKSLQVIGNLLSYLCLTLIRSADTIRSKLAVLGSRNTGSIERERDSLKTEMTWIEKKG